MYASLSTVKSTGLLKFLCLALAKRPDIELPNDGLRAISAHGILYEYEIRSIDRKIARFEAGQKFFIVFIQGGKLFAKLVLHKCH
jgi:hypothetical protein